MWRSDYFVTFRRPPDHFALLSIVRVLPRTISASRVVLSYRRVIFGAARFSNRHFGASFQIQS